MTELRTIAECCAALPNRPSARKLDEFLRKTKVDQHGRPLYRKFGRDKLVYLDRLIEALPCPSSSKIRAKAKARTIRSGGRTMSGRDETEYVHAANEIYAMLRTIQERRDLRNSELVAETLIALKEIETRMGVGSPPSPLIYVAANAEGSKDMSKKKDLDQPPPPPPLCVFCSAPWTDDMLKVSAEADMDWGYYPGEASVDGVDVNIDIVCGSCRRLVYRKEVRNLTNGI